MKSIGAEKTPVGEPVELNAENGWAHTFDGLPVSEKVDGEQIDITYSVEELEVDGFTSKVTGDAASGFTITNTQTPPSTPTPEPTPTPTPATTPTPEPTPTPTPRKKQPPMPRTGAEIGAAALFALVLTGVGAVLVTRRRS